MAVIAPWLQPTNVLQAIQAGSHAGLAARQSDLEEQRMAQQIALARAREEQDAEQAAAKLRYAYDSLLQSRDRARAEAEAKLTAGEAARKLQAARDLDLSQYHAGVLKSKADTLAMQDRLGSMRIDRPFVPKVRDIGGVALREYAPGQLEAIDIPELTNKKSMARITLPIDPMNPGAKLTTFANDPLINAVMGTNAPPGTGTNHISFQKTIAKPLAPSTTAAPVVAPQPNKFNTGTVIRQGDVMYRFNGTDWDEMNKLEEEPEEPTDEGTEEEGAE